MKFPSIRKANRLAVGVASLLVAAAFAPAEVVIETFDGGQNQNLVSQSEGSWASSTGALRLSSDSGSLKFSPNVAGSANVELSVMAPATGNATDLVATLDGTEQSVTFTISPASAGQWITVGSFNISETPFPSFSISKSASSAAAVNTAPMSVEISSVRFVGDESGVSSNIVSEDPFSSANNTGAIVAENPFAAPSTAVAENPFAAPEAAVENPFSAPSNSVAENPFSAPSASVAANPFAAPAQSAPENPFSASAQAANAQPAPTNPFGQPEADNPFTEPSATGGDVVANNPFAPPSAAPADASNPFTNPGTSGTVADNPFNDSSDVGRDFFANVPDQTAFVPDTSAGDIDPFLGTAPVDVSAPVQATQVGALPGTESDGSVAISFDGGQSEFAAAAIPDYAEQSQKNYLANEIINSQKRNFASSGAKRRGNRGSRFVINDSSDSSGASNDSAVQPIEWLNSLEEARREAITANKPIMLVFLLDDERAIQYENSVLFDEEIAALLEKTVPVKIDPDLQPALVQKFAVSSTPYGVLLNKFGFTKTHILLSENRKEVLRQLVESLG